MSVHYPDNAARPVLDLALPAFSDAVGLVLTNNDSGDSLTLDLPSSWDGDDLTLDFAAGTIVDQAGANRLALLSGVDRDLWVAAPLLVGDNDVTVQAHVADAAGSSGPRSPGTVADDASVGATAWANPGNATASDDSRATASSIASTSHYLKATNFGFSLPTDATIVGVVAEIERSEAGGGSVDDSSVKIVKAGSVAGSDKAAVGEWPTTDAYKTYGTAADLWGTSLTPSDVNASNFGVAIAAHKAVSIATARVDHVRLTVYYTEIVDPAVYGATASWRWRLSYS